VPLPGAARDLAAGGFGDHGIGPRLGDVPAHRPDEADGDADDQPDPAGQAALAGGLAATAALVREILCHVTSYPAR
jgi:hypothetical protein